MTRYRCERALLSDGTVAADVVVEETAGVITDVSPASAAADAEAAVRLAGLTVPGMANCHSHAFHRALRGRTQRGHGSFWTWREQMYSLAERLDPDRYFRLARAVYREMAAAGITSVGEFHYLHHGPDGTRYDDPNAMGEALVAAARDVGIRIALLDTCYLAAGIGTTPEGVQRRFSDGDADGWRERVDAAAGRVAAAGDRGVVVGAAVHSVRAVPRHALAEVATWARSSHRPLHVHLSEQVAENEACRAAYGVTPTELLHEGGVLGPLTSAVHATHLADDDIGLLGNTGTHACFCPTTERDLGDGIGPARALAAAGCRLTLGSDSHAVIDPFEEMRALELDERLATQERGHWSAAELVAIGSATGHRSLGFDSAGGIAVGAAADLVAIDPASPRTAGTGGAVESVVFAAGACDVLIVVCDGRVVARREDQAAIGRELESAIADAWEDT